jgi:cyclopropane fatty-acyl-phospholipid synthase-like methyltransferase
MPRPLFAERLARLVPAGLRGLVAARTGSYREFVGPAGEYDLSAASQFSLLTLLGLRNHHSLLDIGCGSLRAGRLFIVYLERERYFGVEPQRWLVESAIRNEIGRDLVRLKKPAFDHHENFRFGVFNRTFDFLLASSIFSHATQTQIDECLREASAVMTPSSLLLASFVSGETSYDGGEWVYPGTVTYTLERIRELAEAHRLEVERLDWPYVGASNQTWLALSPRR